MRHEINLATQPYEDAGRFWAQWIVLLGAMVALTVALVALAGGAWKRGRDVDRRIDQARQQIVSLNREKEQAEVLLSQPENRDVRERSRFLNQLIARKSFSWTQIFADLEKIMPPRVHVVSITPGLNLDNQLEVKLRVAGENRESILELMKRLEASPSFRNSAEQAETTQTQSRSDAVEFEIIALYVTQAKAGRP